MIILLIFFNKNIIKLAESTATDDPVAIWRDLCALSILLREEDNISTAEEAIIA